MNSSRSPLPYSATNTDEQPESHFGDLRKGAYLKRRAEYQMQAATPGANQPGSLIPRQRTQGQKT